MSYIIEVCKQALPYIHHFPPEQLSTITPLYDWITVNTSSDVMTIEDDAPVGEFYVEANFGEGGSATVTIRILDCQPYLKPPAYAACAGQAGSVPIILLGLQPEQTYEVTEVNFGAGFVSLGPDNTLLVSPSSPVGTLFLEIIGTLSGGGSFGFTGVPFTLVDCSEVITTESACTVRPAAAACPIQLVWLDKEGGMDSQIAISNHTFGIDIQESQDFKKTDYTRKYSDRGQIFNTVLCVSDNITQQQVDKFASLITSIQAWHADDIQDPDTYREIFIVTNSFTTYKCTDKLFGISFNFVYSTPGLRVNQ